MLVNLARRCRTERPPLAPLLDLFRQPGPIAGSELLGVSNAFERCRSFVDDNDANNQRTGPCTATNLVNTANQSIALVQQTALEAKVGRT